MKNLSANVAGVLCVVCALFALMTNDSAIKWLSGGYPLHEIVLVRSVIAITITTAIIMPLEGGFRNLRTNRVWLHVLRGIAVVAANTTFFLGLAVIPLPEATALFFAAPLFITLFSVPLLGERVGGKRIAAVLIGLVGVIVVVRPGGDTFQAASILPLCAACCYALLQVATRKVGLEEKASTMAFYLHLAFIVNCSVFGLVVGDGRFAPGDGLSLDFLLRAWTWPSSHDAWIMLGVGVLSSIGAYLICQGYRLAEATIAAPFEYFSMPIALFWSVVLWDEWPDAVTWIGIAMICGAGLFVFYRESATGVDIAADQPLPQDR